MMDARLWPRSLKSGIAALILLLEMLTMCPSNFLRYYVYNVYNLISAFAQWA
jgi:hypothetical protein